MVGFGVGVWWLGLGLQAFRVWGVGGRGLQVWGYWRFVGSGLGFGVWGLGFWGLGSRAYRIGRWLEGAGDLTFRV